MRLTRSAVPTIAASVAVVALISAVVVGSVESKHHSHKSQDSGGQSIPLAQQQSIAHQLNTMTLPKGFAHTTVCPQTATAVDACFSAPLTGTVPSALTAASDTEQMLTSLGITLGLSRSCAAATSGPQGSGYYCQSNGTWHGNTISTTVFVSNAAHKRSTPARLDAMVSVSAS
jgi:hypothetical protein